MPKFHSLAEFVRKRWPHAERDTGRPVEDWPPPRPPARVRSAVRSTANWALSPIASSQHVRLKALLRSESVAARREALQPAYNAYESCMDQLYKALRAGDIIASARAGQPEADAKQLPSSAWTSIRIANWKDAVASYPKDRRLYFDLRLAAARKPLSDGPTQKRLIQNELLEMFKAGTCSFEPGGQAKAVAQIAEKYGFNPRSVRQVVHYQWKALTERRKGK